MKPSLLLFGQRRFTAERFELVTEFVERAQHIRADLVIGIDSHDEYLFLRSDDYVETLRGRSARADIGKDVDRGRKERGRLLAGKFRGKAALDGKLERDDIHTSILRTRHATWLARADGTLLKE